MKIITTGEGGMVMTNSEELQKRMTSLRTHGITKNSKDFIVQDKGSWYYEQQELGYNYRMNDIQAALGISQLKRLKDIVDNRNNAIELYKERLSHSEEIRLITSGEECRSAYHLSVIQLLKSNSVQHKWVFENMRERNIGVQLHYEPIHLNPFYKNKGFSEGDLPNAEKYAKISMSLPIYEKIDKDTIEYVCAELVELVNESKKIS